MLAIDQTTRRRASLVVSGGRLLVDPGGGISEVSPIVTLSATDSARAGLCYYRGFVVRAVSGTVNIVVYDALSATGTPIHTVNGIALGSQPWSLGARRPNSLGVWVVFSGGGTAVIDVEVEERF